MYIDFVPVGVFGVGCLVHLVFGTFGVATLGCCDLFVRCVFVGCVRLGRVKLYLGWVCCSGGCVCLVWWRVLWLFRWWLSRLVGCLLECFVWDGLVGFDLLRWWRVFSFVCFIISCGEEAVFCGYCFCGHGVVVQLVRVGTAFVDMVRSALCCVWVFGVVWVVACYWF